MRIGSAHRASIAVATLFAAAWGIAVEALSSTSSRAPRISRARASPLPTGKNGSQRPCTTSAGIAGGLRALLEHPDQLARLQNDMSLMGTAVEEMIRWVVPVKEFMRTAQEDTEVRGVKIAKGEAVYLAYVSGNRDEEVFKDADKFDVGRDPNKHLSFGYGVHFCLGASLARMEMNSFFSELIPRIKSIELAGEPELMATTVNV